MQDVEDFVTGKGDCKNIIQFDRDDLDETRLTLHRDMCMDVAKQRGVCLATFTGCSELSQRGSGRVFENTVVSQNL